MENPSWKRPIRIIQSNSRHHKDLHRNVHYPAITRDFAVVPRLLFRRIFFRNARILYLHVVAMLGLSQTVTTRTPVVISPSSRKGQIWSIENVWTLPNSCSKAWLLETISWSCFAFCAPTTSLRLLEPRTLYLGGTDPFVLTSRDAPATPCCAFNGLGVELGAAPGRSLVSLAEGWGYKGLPWNTHIPGLRQRLSGSYPLEGQFVGEKKKVIVKTWIGRQIPFSPQNYVLFAVIPTSTFCAQFVAWDSDGLMAFSRSTGNSQLFNSGQDN